MKIPVLPVVVACLFVNPVYADRPDHAKNKGLPPGLQKKVDRGGELPPGWERKLRKGQVLDSQVYDMARPIDDTMRVKLPAGPHGTVDLQIEGRIVRIYKATRIIEAVFSAP